MLTTAIADNALQSALKSFNNSIALTQFVDQSEFNNAGHEGGTLHTLSLFY